jgi:ATP-dependent RNA helicase RhlE
LTDFESLGLAEPILKALATEGYTTPTPIQAKAIPEVLQGRDICGIAQTGTGKTAAFALPIIDRLAREPKRAGPRRVRVLVLSPTRELANQIADSFNTYGRNLRLSVAVVVGGVPIGKQERRLSGGIDILVATPGRLLDLVERSAVFLGDTEVLVLDEADQMLDLGFIHALRRIATLVPKKRQTLFFSATMPGPIASLADTFLTNPVKVAVAPVSSTAERVDQSVIFVETARKQPLLETILRNVDMQRVIVFTRTKHGADRVVKHLDRAGIESAAIHGNKSQGQRERALGAFKTGHCRILVATDIAARGIDVDGVTHVVNFDLPNVPESYVHRIGRTARAGASGEAVSFCNGEERSFLKQIERLTRRPIPVRPMPEGVATAAAFRSEHAAQDRLEEENAERNRDHGHGRPEQVGRNRRPSHGDERGHGGRGPSRGNGGGFGGQGRGNGGGFGGQGRGRRAEPREDGRDVHPAFAPASARDFAGNGQANEGRGGWSPHADARPSHEERTREARPARAERPHGERPHGDRAHGDRAQAGRPEHRNRDHAGGKPAGERKSDRPARGPRDGQSLPNFVKGGEGRGHRR